MTLTMGELAPAEGPVLVDRFSESMARLAQLRRIPGYGQNILKTYGSALDPTVLNGELLRLKLQQEQALSPSPIASAFNALKNAYEERDVFNIQRWEGSVERARARRWLNRVRTMAHKDKPLGYVTAGFWQQHPGMSGLGEQVSYKNIGGGWAKVTDQYGNQYQVPLWQAQQQAARLRGPVPTGAQQRAASRAAQQSEYQEFRRLATEGKLPPGVRNVGQLRRYRQQAAASQARRQRQQQAQSQRQAAAQRRRAQQEEQRQKSRARREEETQRMDKYTEKQLEQIRDNPDAPTWQRRLAGKKLWVRAYQAQKTTGAVVGKGPGKLPPPVKRYQSPGYEKPFAVYGGKKYTREGGQTVSRPLTAYQRQFAYQRRGGAIFAAGGGAPSPQVSYAVAGLGG